ncbi:MAG TPA: FAD/NAD(P)-binding protein [Sphingomonas sp.]|uniref:FAD/NAD(P)-binding protein n=1 Tax=Sphingomonas sp. TaxID=28214 RepID=UPI002ED984F3
MVRHVAIIGGGFAGALMAVNLLRHDGPTATLIERRSQAGLGVAYSAAHPDHRLNVRAGNMSALPDDPGHFERWLADRHPAHVGGFAPRLIYGDYLTDLLSATAARSNGRLRIVRGDAVDLALSDAGTTVTLDDGSRIAADAVVLATGNLPPHTPPGIDPALLGPDRYAADPWAADVADGLRDDDTVLLLGGGLTMVDVALLLDARGFRGRMLALSRRGLLPRAHGDAPAAPLAERPQGSPANLLRQVRARAAQTGWRSAVDALRPHTQSLWRGAEAPDRARFLRHLRPWWDVHRHRLAPQVADRVAALRAAGGLRIVAGKLEQVLSGPAGMTLRYRPRGDTAGATLPVRRIVNCTGPLGDIRRTSEPLLRGMLDRGLIRPDPLQIGIDVDPQSAVLDRDGATSGRLFAIGPMTRGTFWEIVAVPDIRQQTWSVARRLSNAMWVGGEGL